MAGQLSQKERMLLQDNLKHEELCIWKYRGYAGRTSTPELKNMLNEIAQEEENHYNTLSGFLGGSGPTGSGSAAGGGGSGSPIGGGYGKPGGGQKRQPFGTEAGMETAPVMHVPGGTTGYPQGGLGGGFGPTHEAMNLPMQESSRPTVAEDSKILTDLLATEKYISGTYNVSVFETTDPRIRQSLQHIQQDEQKHGEKLFNYMQRTGMYQVNQ